MTISAGEQRSGKVHRIVDGTPQCGTPQRTIDIHTPLVEEAVSCRSCINARDDEPVLVVACPRCGAHPGEPCSASGSGKPVRPHKKRRDLFGQTQELNR